MKRPSEIQEIFDKYSNVADNIKYINIKISIYDTLFKNRYIVIQNNNIILFVKLNAEKIGRKKMNYLKNIILSILKM